MADDGYTQSIEPFTMNQYVPPNLSLQPTAPSTRFAALVAAAERQPVRRL